MAVNFEQATLAWTIPWEADWVTAVSFVGSTRKLAAGNQLGQIFLWDLPEKPGGPVPAPARRLDGHTNAITALTSTPDDRWLISSSYDHTVRLWDMQAAPKGTDSVILDAKARADAAKKSGKPADTNGAPVDLQEAGRIIDTHQEWVRSLSLSGDGKRLLTGDDRGIAILWELPEVKEAKRLQVRGWLQAVAISPDGQLGATCEYAPRYSGFPNAIKLWDLSTGAVKFDLSKEFQRSGSSGVAGMVAAAFSNDGKLLALGQGGEGDGNIKAHLVDTANGKKLRELAGHQYGVTDVVFHPDGKHLASCGRDTVVRVWQIADGKMVKELGKARGGQFKDWTHAVAFTADGAWMAAGDMAGQVHVWSIPPSG